MANLKNRDYHRWGISDIAKCILFDDLLILVSWKLSSHPVGFSEHLVEWNQSIMN